MEIKPETFLKNKSLLSLESDFDTVFIPGSFCIQQSNFVLSCIVCWQTKEAENVCSKHLLKYV